MFYKEHLIFPMMLLKIISDFTNKEEGVRGLKDDETIVSKE